ncbi:MAG: zinc ribbon domain-containing protein [bacterium]|nr:zinc ribbon domain-containing protein [bacterium]
MTEFDEEKEYEGRADDIEGEDLEKWTVENNFFAGIQKKILQRGAKLIVGPRGTGKTHQMRLAYRRCQRNKKYPLAIYVSFGKYYHLEPLLTKTSVAIQIFHTWVLCKVLLACFQLCRELELPQEEMGNGGNAFRPDELEQFVSLAEKGMTAEAASSDIFSKLAFQYVIDIIEDLSADLKRTRAIILLDDAALTLTPDYLVEFFDVFRSLKTRAIAPKASVYPGTTEYGPRFHVGHDAEKVDAWPFFQAADYGKFMGSLMETRLAAAAEQVPNDIIQLFEYAAFGVPRAFINLIRNFTRTGGNTQQRYNNVINTQRQFITDEYFSLQSKLPQFKDIIQVGYDLFRSIVGVIAKENKGAKAVDTRLKQIEIGIQEDEDTQDEGIQFDRMIKFLIEAGLLYELQPVHHGVGRKYNRYVPHLLFLFEKRAFSPGRGFDPQKILKSLNRKSQRHPLRRTFSTLLTRENRSRIRLNLPKCKKCGADRLTEGQKFCHRCGNELVDQSIFEKCMGMAITELPLTEWQKESIDQYTSLRTVGDFIALQSPAAELQKVRMIGEKRSESIMKAVGGVIEEFFS